MNTDDDFDLNPTRRPHLLDLDEARRRWLKRVAAVGVAGSAATVLTRPVLAASAARRGTGTRPTISFEPVPVSSDDAVHVPKGYGAEVLIAWGDPIDGKAPRFDPQARNSAEDQERQWGQHNDGMSFFPLPRGSNSSRRGLLVSNHEYADPGLMFPDGFTEQNLTPARVRKVQAAHGVSVVAIELREGRWRVVDSPYARRITGFTPMELTGPAAGHELMQTAADPDGRRVLGTLNNCAHGVTPWGTYLACEENFNAYFGTDVPGFDTARNAVMRRYGVTARGAGYRWHPHDERFDIGRHPNESNRFGWVVEIDPFDPTSTPKKRTALGRLKHECATVVLARDGRVVVYTGDDQVNEYVYKFVSRRRWVRGKPVEPQRLLDEGTLYVARFDGRGRGRWLPLVHGQHGLDANAGFADQASVLVNTRRAADVVGATRLDRPEWIAAHPRTREIYVSLTGNPTRGTDNGPPVDGANPRRDNRFGHILRWREAGGDAAALEFDWDLFAQAGNPTRTEESYKGDIDGDAFACPDGLWFDAEGTLWIQTDIPTASIGTGVYEGLGNNQMLAADAATGRIRRFLVGPPGCEITGMTMTPDARWLFVNIQHPGETAGEGPNKPDPATWRSHWPDGGQSRPRSATIVIRRLDGGRIGS